MGVDGTNLHIGEQASGSVIASILATKNSSESGFVEQLRRAALFDGLRFEDEAMDGGSLAASELKIETFASLAQSAFSLGNMWLIHMPLGR